ncbi:hypothetical protein TcYC6_0019990 [Trypanosoma cruzi]|nr:hypothetical protein TcYC6_0010460 [Trypanosoma cruzi]KAF8284989.1 hypothetical protein TcYC6_0019990 [Trypanosoma cruzi]
MRLARQLRSYGCEGGNFGWLRRRAAREVAAIMTASDTPARHMSALRLRRHVVHCLQSWGAGELQAIREGPLHGGHGVRSEGRGGRGAMRCGKGAGCCGRTSLSSLQFVVMKGCRFCFFFTGGLDCGSLGCWEERVRACCAFRESCGRTVIRGGVADGAGVARGEGQGARCLSLLWELRCIDSPLGSWNPRANSGACAGTTEPVREA